MTGGLTAPATVGRMIRSEEETASQIDRGYQDGIEVPVDPTKREDVEKDARIRANFGRSRIFPL